MLGEKLGWRRRRRLSPVRINAIRDYGVRERVMAELRERGVGEELARELTADPAAVEFAGPGDPVLRSEYVYVRAIGPGDLVGRRFGEAARSLDDAVALRRAALGGGSRLAARARALFGR